MAPAEELIVATALADFDRGFAEARRRAREGHGRLVGTALDGLLVSATGALHLRRDMEQDVRFLVGLAREVTAGADPKRLAEENLKRALRWDRLRLVARVQDDAFDAVLDTCRENFAKRLPDLARMAAVDDAADYADLVRRAFPDRAYVEEMVHENAAFVLAIVDHIQRHPHLLRAPGNLVPRVADMAREVTEWQTERVLEGVASIYGGA